MSARRQVLRVIAASVLAAPFSSRGQQQTARIHRIGYLSPLTPAADSTRSEAFRRGLQDLGYVEGRNILIERRFSEGRLDRLAALAAELVRLKVEVIVAAGGAVIARAARSATTAIPIVMTNVEDPVASGLVASLAKPGGNVTGLTAVIPDLSAKRMELVKESLSKVTRVAALWNPAYPDKLMELKETQAAAAKLGIQLQSLEVRSAVDVEPAIAAAAKAGAGALITLPDPVTNTQQARIVELAAKERLPTMFTQRPPVDLGGLMSYGPNYADLFRRSATYVDKILKGAKPAELPVEQPTRFELVLNMRTAKALGITFPHTILVRAEQVIE